MELESLLNGAGKFFLRNFFDWLIELLKAFLVLLSGDWLIAQRFLVVTGDLIDGDAFLVLFEGAKGLVVVVVCLFFEGFEFFLNRLVLIRLLGHDGILFFRKLLLLLDGFINDRLNRISMLLGRLMLCRQGRVNLLRHFLRNLGHDGVNLFIKITEGLVIAFFVLLIVKFAERLIIRLLEWFICLADLFGF